MRVNKIIYLIIDQKNVMKKGALVEEANTPKYVLF